MLVYGHAGKTPPGIAPACCRPGYVPQSRELATAARSHQHLKGGPFAVSKQPRLDESQQAISALGHRGSKTRHQNATQYDDITHESILIAPVVLKLRRRQKWEENNNLFGRGGIKLAGGWRVLTAGFVPLENWSLLLRYQILHQVIHPSD